MSSDIDYVPEKQPVHYRVPGWKYLACSEPMDEFHQPLTTSNKKAVTCKKCRKKIAQKKVP